MTTLITGADGYLGSRIAAALPEEELILAVRCADAAEFERKRAALGECRGRTVVPVDLRDPNPLAQVDPSRITRVIHAAAMGYRTADRKIPKDPGTGSSAEIIRLATMASLSRAEELRLKSIAFPALATGVARFPVDRCAEAMITAARDYGAAHAASSIELVVFVLFTLDDYETFKQFADPKTR